jgi:hypothetical protein
MQNITDLEESFNSLQELSDSQFRTIASLKKEMALLKEENKALKSNPVSPTSNSSDIVNFDISNERLICETQITILKDRAITRELLLEEAKKFQIFVDILDNIKKNTPNASKVRVEKLSTEELLALVEGGDSGSTIN